MRDLWHTIIPRYFLILSSPEIPLTGRDMETQKIQGFCLLNNLYHTFYFKNPAAPLASHIQDASALDHVRHDNEIMSSRYVIGILLLT